MAIEIHALELNNTWIVTDLPSGKHPIGCKWVYKIKHKANGEVERYKVRLLAKGYTKGRIRLFRHFLSCSQVDNNEGF
jgi:hypothetical protein